MNPKKCACFLLSICLCIFFLVPSKAPGSMVQAVVVVKIGDIPDNANGDPVSVLNSPFTDGNGVVGFTGAVLRTSVSDHFVWYDDQPVWYNSDATGLTGAENYMGVGNNGKYIYSPQYNGNLDSVWTQDGSLLQEDQTSPGVTGMLSSFNSRPSMLPDGTVYWLSGWTDTQGGASLGRVLYRSADTSTPVIEPVLKTGDAVGGFVIASPAGLDFDYMISDNDLHHVQVIDMDTGSSLDDGFVYVDGALVAREASLAADGESGENWDNFDLVSINNSGNHIFSGDTDGDTLTDEFIAYNGTISIREGQTLDGIELTSSCSVQGLAINNQNQAVHLWTVSSGDEHLFFTRNAANLADSVCLLSTSDTLDVDGDGVADYTVTDFKATSSTRYNAWLAEDGKLYVKLSIDDGGGAVEAIVCIPLQTGTVNPALPLLLLD